jgi:small subunit ribosomal protein S7
VNYIIYKEGRKVPRKGPVTKREILEDPIYGTKVVTKLINKIMLEEQHCS